MGMDHRAKGLAQSPTLGPGLLGPRRRPSLPRCLLPSVKSELTPAAAATVTAGCHYDGVLPLIGGLLLGLLSERLSHCSSFLRLPALAILKPLALLLLRLHLGIAGSTGTAPEMLASAELGLEAQEEVLGLLQPKLDQGLEAPQ